MLQICDNQNERLEPHRQRHFKLPTNPFFMEKVRDIAWTLPQSLGKSDDAVCGEKNEIQARDRIQPRLPMGLGYLEGVIHDCVWDGTTTLFAARDIANGQVLTACKKRHRHQEYLQFLKQVDASVLADMAIHLVVIHHATHKHPVSSGGWQPTRIIKFPPEKMKP